MIEQTIHHWKNAQAVIKQIKNGEWILRWNPISNEHLTAKRVNGHSSCEKDELWLGNGGFFVDVNNKNAFGLLFRHYVWWAAARKFKARADRKHQKTSWKEKTVYLYKENT